MVISDELLKVLGNVVFSNGSFAIESGAFKSDFDVLFRESVKNPNLALRTCLHKIVCRTDLRKPLPLQTMEELFDILLKVGDNPSPTPNPNPTPNTVMKNFNGISLSLFPLQWARYEDSLRRNYKEAINVLLASPSLPMFSYVVSFIDGDIASRKGNVTIGVVPSNFSSHFVSPLCLDSSVWKQIHYHLNNLNKTASQSKIDAIKELRQSTGLVLKEAKDFMDAYCEARGHRN